MPLYEYECEVCGRRFERIQKFSDPPVETCPSCEGKVRKLISSPAIQFKGSGWYITDYAKKSGGAGQGGAADKPASEGADKTDKTDKSGASASSEKPDAAASKPAAPSSSTKSET